MRDRITANRLLVHPAHVRQIHQVVGDQLMMSGHMGVSAAVRPASVVMPGIGRDVSSIGACRVTHPDPQRAIALFQRVATNACVFRNLLLRRDVHTAPAFVVRQSVITADDAVAADLPHRQRQVAMAATIFQRDCSAIRQAVQHHRIAEQGAGQGFVRDFVRPGRDIPAIADEHGCSFLTAPECRRPARLFSTARALKSGNHSPISPNPSAHTFQGRRSATRCPASGSHG